MQAKLVVALAGVFIAGSALARDTYTIDSRHTFPVVETKHLGFSTQRGRFNNTSGKIALDRAAKNGSIDVTIQVASIDMGIEKWDEHLKSEDFFNAAKFPTITFKSNKLVFNGDVLAGAEGELTMLGVTKPVTLAVVNFRCGPNPVTKKEMCGADTSTTIRRSDWGMKYGAPIVISDEVKISIPVEAYKDN